MIRGWMASGPKRLGGLRGIETVFKLSMLYKKKMTGWIKKNGFTKHYLDFGWIEEYISFTTMFYFIFFCEHHFGQDCPKSLNSPCIDWKSNLVAILLSITYFGYYVLPCYRLSVLFLLKKFASTNLTQN